MRYVVTELEGFAINLPLVTRGNSPTTNPGLSVHVVDVPYNRLVAELRGTLTDRCAALPARVVRHVFAAPRCDHLNAAWRSPTCLVCSRAAVERVNAGMYLPSLKEQAKAELARRTIAERDTR